MAIDEFIFDSGIYRVYDRDVDPLRDFFENMRWKKRIRYEGNDSLLDEDNKERL